MANDVSTTRRVAGWVVGAAVFFVVVWFWDEWPTWGKTLYIGLCAGVWIGAGSTQFWHRRAEQQRAADEAAADEDQTNLTVAPTEQRRPGSQWWSHLHDDQPPF